ncbi:MAG TPA: UDP-galactopyranose mutase, partial [Opitutaceae bacterium]
LKQWGRPASRLDASVCRRIPVRTNLDERYFQETFQALPCRGYTAMFENMIESARFDLKLGIDYREVLPFIERDHLIYTGPLDEYFNCQWGRLPYRSLRFNLEEISNVSGGFAQPVLQINYPGSEEYTRTVEVKHITGQKSRHTNIVREYSQEYKAGESEPYYPVPGPESQALAERYRRMADQEPNVTFIGRLATYRYLNMDQVVAAALHTAEKLLQRHRLPAAV